MIRAIVIDDHRIVRDGLIALLDAETGIDVVGQYASAAEALADAASVRPDLALVDISLGEGITGLELVERLRERFPAMRFLVMSMHDDPALVLRAREVGAHGFATKGVSAHELVDLCLKATTVDWLVSSDLGAGVPASRRPNLTARESEVLLALLGGDAPKRVADRLGMSDKTLYRHRANLLEKIGARTMADLARIARERGLLAP